LKLNGQKKKKALKYFFQFCFIEDRLYNAIDFMSIENFINDNIDGRKLRKSKINYHFHEKFKTNYLQNKKYYFLIIAWEIY
jgi:hypothetical protein